MPQYMLICVTLQHWFRSERLVTLLNRIRDPETYSIKLEIALTQAVDQTPGLLSTQIVRSPIDLWAIHSEFDNFDHLLNDLTWMRSVHIAHGIMLQDIQGEQVDHRGTIVDTPFVARDATTKHSPLESNALKTVPQTHLLHNEKSLIITQQTYPDGDIHLRNKHAWGVFPGCCYRWNVVPHRMGRYYTDEWDHISKPYNYWLLPSQLYPITDYRTVQECLKYTEMQELKLVSSTS